MLDRRQRLVLPLHDDRADLLGEGRLDRVLKALGHADQASDEADHPAERLLVARLVRRAEDLLGSRALLRELRHQRREQVAAGLQVLAVRRGRTQRLATLLGLRARLLDAPFGDIATAQRLGGLKGEAFLFAARGQRAPSVVAQLVAQRLAPRVRLRAIAIATLLLGLRACASRLGIADRGLDAGAARLGFGQFAQYLAHGPVGGAHRFTRCLQLGAGLGDPRLEGDERAAVRRGALRSAIALRGGQFRDGRVDLIAAHEQQFAALLGEGALLAERQRAFRQLALAPLCAGQLRARSRDGAFGHGDVRGEGLGLPARRGERLGSLVVARLRGGQRLAGLPQFGLVPGFEGGAELGVEFAEAARALRLPLQLPQARGQLADQHPHVAEVVARLRQPPVRSRQFDAVAVDLGGLLDQVAALQRPQAEHLVDEAPATSSRRSSGRPGRGGRGPARPAAAPSAR